MRYNADYTVQNRKILKEILKVALARFGTQMEVSEQTGLNQGMISKLANGTIRTLTPKTLLGLGGVLTEQEWARLTEAMMSPEAKNRYYQYIKGITDDCGSHNCRITLARDFEFGVGDCRVADFLTPEIGRFSGGSQHATFTTGTPHCPGAPTSAMETLKELGEIPEVRERLWEFYRWLELQWADAADTYLRWQLARLDIAAPLIHGANTGGIERTVTEMHREGDLVRYIDSAIDAQKHLLRRDTSWARARQAAEGLPESAPKRRIRPNRRRPKRGKALPGAET